MRTLIISVLLAIILIPAVYYATPRPSGDCGCVCTEEFCKCECGDNCQCTTCECKFGCKPE